MNFIKVPIRYYNIWTTSYININNIVIIIDFNDEVKTADTYKRYKSYSNDTKSLIYLSDDSEPFECSLSANEVDILILNA